MGQGAEGEEEKEEPFHKRKIGIYTINWLLITVYYLLLTSPISLPDDFTRPIFFSLDYPIRIKAMGQMN